MNDLALTPTTNNRHWQSENSFYTELVYPENQMSLALGLTLKVAALSRKGFRTPDGFKYTRSEDDSENGQRRLRIYFSR